MAVVPTPLAGVWGGEANPKIISILFGGGAAKKNEKRGLGRRPKTPSNRHEPQRYWVVAATERWYTLDVKGGIVNYNVAKGWHPCQMILTDTQILSRQ